MWQLAEMLNLNKIKNEQDADDLQPHPMENEAIVIEPPPKTKVS